MQALHINGNNLTLEDVRQLVYERRPVLLQPEARMAVEKARAIVDDLVENERVAYAVNTGVGHLADMRISRPDIQQLQVNLIRSHSVGVGEPLAEDVTRAMMLLRANSLAKGFSGVRPLIIDTLCGMLNRGVHPVIPSQGSVGASGDLAPLAHLALGMIGEGEAVFEGKVMPAAEAMKRAEIKPLVLEAKEAISLINGTQAMLAVGLLTVLQAEILADTADVVGALTLDALKGTDVAFDERIHKARPHPGQLLVAQNLRRMLEGSVIRESHLECQKVQDAYSLRCIPQVHGAVRDTLDPLPRDLRDRDELGGGQSAGVSRGEESGRAQTASGSRLFPASSSPAETFTASRWPSRSTSWQSPSVRWPASPSAVWSG